MAFDEWCLVRVYLPLLTAVVVLVGACTRGYPPLVTMELKVV